MVEPQVKSIGELTKYRAIEVPYVEIDGFFRDAHEEDWGMEDILDAWHEKEEFNNILLFPLQNHLSQFNLIREFIPSIYEVQNKSYQGEFIFLIEEDKIELSDIRNAEELSGEGVILTNFNLKFADYPKKYTKNNNIAFFNLNPDQIIINNIRLVVDNTTPSLGLKLTGRAAEIQARRESLS